MSLCPTVHSCPSRKHPPVIARAIAPVAIRSQKNTPESFDSGVKSLFSGLEAVLQAYRAVEDQMLGCAVLAVGAEVAKTHKLVGFAGLCIF